MTIVENKGLRCDMEKLQDENEKLKKDKEKLQEELAYQLSQLNDFPPSAITKISAGDVNRLCEVKDVKNLGILLNGAFKQIERHDIPVWYILADKTVYDLLLKTLPKYWLEGTHLWTAKLVPVGGLPWIIFIGNYEI